MDTTHIVVLIPQQSRTLNDFLAVFGIKPFGETETGTSIIIPYIDEDAIFIGNVFPQFGHFLLEHMNRAYALLDDKYKNMKLILVNWII